MKKPLFFPVFLLLLFGLNVSASDAGNAGEEGVPREKISGDITEIIKLLEKDYPLFFRKISSEKENELVRRFVNSLGHGIRYVKEEEDKAQESISDKICPAVNIFSNKVFYVRIDAFGDGQLKQLEEDIKGMPGLLTPQIGIILDLRNSRSHNTEKVSGFLSLLAPLGREMSKEKKEQGKGLPIIILTGKNTEGDAEILTELLKNSGKCVTIGSKSAGKQFKARRIALDKGNCVEVPEIPEAFEDINIKPLVPSIEIKGAQIDYEKISKEKDSEKTDPCISCASDLLTGMDAISPKPQ